MRWTGTAPQIPGHDSIAAAARALYDGRGGALRQMIHKIETAAGFTIIDRSSTPLAITAAGREFIQEALQILGTAQEQEDGPRMPA
jgi:DNA-binding transcriptional LysR family regulator